MANPLIKLELIRRFRPQSAAWGIPLLIALPGLAVTLIYWTTTAGTGIAAQVGPMGDPEFAMQGGGLGVHELQGIGIGMFFAVIATLLAALVLMVPAMVGGSIAGERHNQTLQPLQLTAMTPTQIVLGKMVSSSAYLLVLLLCAAPVMAIPFLLGGMSVTQSVGAYVIIVLIAIEFAAISLAVSSFMARPATAIMISLIACAFLVAAPWIALTVGMMVQTQADLNFDPAASSLRVLASPSPIALASWVPLGDDVDAVVRTSDRVLSLFWYVVVVVGSLLFARSRVVAPVERDR